MGKYDRLVGWSSNLPPKLGGRGGRSTGFLQSAVRRNFVHGEALVPLTFSLGEGGHWGQPGRASVPFPPQEEGRACLATLEAVCPGFRAWMGQCFSNRDPLEPAAPSSKKKSSRHLRPGGGPTPAPVPQGGPRAATLINVWVPEPASAS